MEHFSICNSLTKPSWLRIWFTSSKDTHYRISPNLVSNLLEWSISNDVEVLWWKEINLL